MPRIKDTTVMKFLILILIFLILNFNRDLGLVYSLMILADFMWWWIDLRMGNKKTDLPFERTSDNRLKAILEAIIAYVAFLFISTIVYGIVAPGGPQAVIQLLSTSTPILKGSVILTIIGWGVLIPIVETDWFFGRLAEGLSNEARDQGTKIPLDRFKASTWVLMALVSALFALFHISAKNLENSSLIVTFIFGMISMYLVIRNRELKQAVIFHIISNTVATLAALGFIL
jgi:membrane protease YdiL (CAAX protease family)